MLAKNVKLARSGFTNGRCGEFLNWEFYIPSIVTQIDT